MAREEYGIGILKVKEIIGMMAVTAIPQTPAFIKGVINLGEKVIPVIDRRLKFDMESVAYTDRTCIIVVEIQGKDRKIQMGIVKDPTKSIQPIVALRLIFSLTLQEHEEP